MINIIVVEDQNILKDSLINTINSTDDMKVTAQTSDAADSPKLCAQNECDVVLMDICTEHGHSGIDAAAEIKKPSLKRRLYL